MRALHRTMMSVTLAALLVFAVGAIHPWSAALAQHGHESATQHGHEGTTQHGDAAQHEATSPEEHFHAVLEHLELTEAQQEVLAEPLHDAFAAMQELHRLHEVIVAELTEEQQKTLAEMVHSMMGTAPTAGHGEDPHGGANH